MATLKEIEEDIKSIEVIKSISNIYHEIANFRMRQIRERVLKNRYFFEELLGVYQRVKSASLLINKGKEKEEKNKTEEKKKEEIIVVLSANKPFYGSLILDIWKAALAYYKKKNPDLLVVGRIGKYLVESSGLGYKMFYFELSDDHPEKENIAAIIDFIKPYKRIVVFYGKYKTVISQNPVMSEISELPFKKVEDVEKYLFEPSPEAILDFFEKEIIAALFHQCLLEHQLARYASRVISMYRARENAKNFENNLEKIKRRLKKQIENKEQIELFSKVIYE